MVDTLDFMPCLIKIMRLLFVSWVSEKRTLDVRFRNVLILMSKKLEITYDTLMNFSLILFDCGLDKIWLRDLAILLNFA